MSIPGSGLWAGLVAAVLATAPAPLPAQDAGGIRLGAQAPVVTVNDLDGKPVDLGQWIGKKPVLLEFWATWCENCEALLPRLKAAHAAYGKKMEFIAVNVTVNQTPDRVRRYVESHEVPFRVLYDDQAASTRAYLAPATSYIVVVNAAGKVVYTGVGADQQFEKALKGLAD